MMQSGLAAHTLTLVAFWLAAGTAIGTLFFLTLRRNVQMLADGRSMLPAVALQIGRLAVTGIALAAIAIHFGALPLLTAAAGILLARTVIVRGETGP